MECFDIIYSHRRGTFTASKWADTAPLALDAVKRAHKRVSLSTAVGRITYSKAVLVQPQPFSDESRALWSARLANAAPRPAEVSSVVVDFSARDDEPEILGDEYPAPEVEA